MADAVRLVRDNAGETDDEEIEYGYDYDPNGNLVGITDASPGARVDLYEVSYTGLLQLRRGRGGRRRGEAAAADPLAGDDRDTYVLAFEEAGRDPASGDVTEGATCVAEAIVDGVGVEGMRDVATPREIADAANGQGASLTELGVEVDTGRADTI